MATNRGFKPVIFVSGPYSAKNKATIYSNVSKAASVAKQLWRAGFAVICPHKNSAYFDGPEEAFYQGYLEILRRCDAVFVLPGWQRSEGAQREVRLAKKLGILVFEDIVDAMKWLEQRGRADGGGDSGEKK